MSVLQVSNGQVINRYDDITTAARSVDGQVSHISECMRLVPHRNTLKDMNGGIQMNNQLPWERPRIKRILDMFPNSRVFNIKRLTIDRKETNSYDIPR